MKQPVSTIDRGSSRDLWASLKEEEVRGACEGWFLRVMVTVVEAVELELKRERGECHMGNGRADSRRQYEMLFVSLTLGWLTFLSLLWRP